MNYTVAKITTPTGVFFTSRNDNRTAEEVVADGISGYRNGVRSKIYSTLNHYQVCKVQNIFHGLNKDQADSKKKILIEYERALGAKVLNAR